MNESSVLEGRLRKLLEGLETLEVQGDAFRVVHLFANGSKGRFAVSGDLLLRAFRELNVQSKSEEDVPLNYKIEPEIYEPVFTAAEPEKIEVESILGSDRSAIIFHTDGGPKAFALTEDEMRQLAERLLQETGSHVRVYRKRH